MISNANISAANGMQHALHSYGKAAARIADPHTNLSADDVLKLKASERQFELNAKVVATADRMTGRLIDIIA